VLARLALAALLAPLTGSADPADQMTSHSSGALAHPPAEHVVLAAGDIARCDLGYDEATARLLDRRPGVVLVLGDAAYPSGAPSEYARCYAPSWGRHRMRTYAVAGNHDYRTRGAAGYLGYFGAAGGRTGHYSFEIGPWHVVALDSNQPLRPGSAQHRWLAADLAKSDARCTLAFFHHPRFSSGEHGNQPQVRAAWALLYAHGVELVLSGHDHDYERFAAQTPDGRRDDLRGIRQFVVGTGGAPLRPFGAAKAHSEVRDAAHHGVLALLLRDDGYEWTFVGSAGLTLDRGHARCHEPRR
jgi:3',5'-cyclic AMP phosphodiesterase CpdA